MKAAGSALERLGNEKPVQALLVSNDRFFIARRNRLATLAAPQGLPMIYPFREMADLWIGKLRVGVSPAAIGKLPYMSAGFSRVRLKPICLSFR